MIPPSLAMEPAASFYRRPLPTPLIPFAGPEGRALFREALSEGNLDGYFALAEQFHTQADPAFCGLGTLVVALNALNVDPGRLWKGPWRWFSEDLLDCCLPLDTVRREGVTLDTFACLARCNGASTVVRRPDTATLDDFREDLRLASTSSSGPVLAVAYSRKSLGQTGDGHYSPVAGMHAARDLALVLDVARFKYPPYWVPIPLLYEAMTARDPSTGKPRGWVMLRRREAGTTLLFRLSDARMPWAEVTRRLFAELPDAISAAAPDDLSSLVSAVARVAPTLPSDIFDALTAAVDALAPEHRAKVDALLSELRGTPLFALSTEATATLIASLAEFLAMLLLTLPDEVFAQAGEGARDALAAQRDLASMPAPLRTEVEVLREQLVALHELYGHEATQPACCAAGG